MGFSGKQLRALQRSVPARNIRTRHLNGRELAYIEGWHAIAEANRIFGFDGWDRETIESRCIAAREQRGSVLALYSVKVRITVRADGVTIVREGNGTGEARGSTPGEAHEVALKAAETDATKRALTTFGKPFGLALYGTRAKPAIQDNDGARPAVHGGRNGASKWSRSDEAPQVTGAQPEESVQPPPSPIQAPPVPDKVDKSVLIFGTPRRERDKDHLRFVGTQPCLICSRVPSDAHHLRFAQTRALGRKVGDQYTVPLCRTHHRQLHDCSDESAWWTDLEIDAIEIAKGLWEETRAKRAALVRGLPGAVDPIGNGKV